VFILDGFMDFAYLLPSTMSSHLASAEASCSSLEVISPPDPLVVFLGQMADLTAEQAERLFRSVFRCEDALWCALRRIQDAAIRELLATRIFGEKLSRDLGFVSTQGNPKMDFGEPRFCGSWDLDEK